MPTGRHAASVSAAAKARAGWPSTVPFAVRPPPRERSSAEQSRQAPQSEALVAVGAIVLRATLEEQLSGLRKVEGRKLEVQWAPASSDDVDVLRALRERRG